MRKIIFAKKCFSKNRLVGAREKNNFQQKSEAPLIEGKSHIEKIFYHLSRIGPAAAAAR